ncbi:olfactory receptor 2K2-like [Ambystoma mexicanum]|uniref:olfactory receptor 2K2-like n=1 Tax=Ambystoma mexicanum TaxID=8296 RepID=UPI0037E719FF
MEKGNQSLVTEFILLGFSASPQIKIVLFVVFLAIYLVTLIANSLIITVVRSDSRLHSPMYFFICNLSFIDLCYSSTNCPTCLDGLFSETSTITFSGCVTQMYMGFSLGSTQCILLALMSWDRYVAICNPLNYPRILRRSVCMRLTIATWTAGFLLPIVHVSIIMTVPFCGQNRINHVVCELAAVLHLACIDTHLIQAVIFLFSVITLVAPLSLIIFTYLHIISTILRMPTSTGRHKAFSTCGSHLTVVTLFYGTAIAMYMSPRSLISRENEKVVSLIYGLMTPMLNPLIYTLRNKEVKGSMKKMFSRYITWHMLKS